MNSNKKLLISNWLNIEESYTLSFDYFKMASCKIDIEMRGTLLAWMLDVCEEQECTNEVFALAVNLFDRFMCLNFNGVDKTHLQLIAIASLLISSKLKAGNSPLDSIQLIEYTANTFELEELLLMELSIMDSLKWDVLAVCPNDFLDVFLDECKLDLSQEQMKLLHEHSHAFTALSSLDFAFAYYSPSTIASACFLAALNEIAHSSYVDQLEKLSVETQSDVDFLGHVTQHFKSLFMTQFTSPMHDQNLKVEFSFNFENSFEPFPLNEIQCESSTKKAKSSPKLKCKHLQQTKSCLRRSGRMRG